ncbi:MAG: tandem-95 repeat protein [Bdellovibrionales bacterium]|nr:tandem-95 repeat protein [Bdellovibrionales bacterium]
MRTISRLGVVLALLNLCWGLSARAEAVCDPKFTTTEFNLNTAAGELFEVGLRSLLVDPLPGEALDWATFGAAPPAWLEPIPAPGETLRGTPTVNDSGTHSFNLSVQCGDNGAFAQIRIHVLIVPKWKNAPNELFLGDIPEDGTLDINLKDHITTADNNPNVTFTATGLEQNAPWLVLESSGRLHGTPPWTMDHSLVGAFSGIVFTATHPSGGSAETHANGTVQKYVKPPKWTKNPISLPDVNEGVHYDEPTALYVVSAEQNPLQFERLSGPTWLQMDTSTGRLTGTPTRTDVGHVSLRARVFFVEDGNTYADETIFEFNVLKVNHAPEWLSDPILLPDAFTGVSYPVQNLASAVSDADNDTLSFTIVDGPTWAKLTTDGKFSGTPAKSNVGENKWTVEVRDPDGATDRATVIVKVIKSNEPPHWLVKPTVLPDGKEDQFYSQDLKTHATDPDNDPLAFTILSGPSWASVNSSGALVGTPTKDDVGLQKFTIRVADGNPGHFDDAEVLVLIDKTNHAPRWILDPVFQVNEDQLLAENIARFVVDSDPDEQLTFEIRSANPPSNWATVTPDGTNFGGTPKQANVGENQFIVRVTDKGGLYDEATVTVIVIDINHKPAWTKNPIILPDATEGKAYNQSLASYAIDADNDPLTFVKVNAAEVSWLNVRDSGAVWGTPERTDVGTKTFKARVSDPKGEFADVTVQITVLKVNAPPRWTRNPIPLGKVRVGENLHVDIKPYVVDDDNDALTFSKQAGAGPAWLQVSADGIVTGIPSKADIGSFTTILVVNDGTVSVPVNGVGEVLPGAQPPVIDPEIAYIMFENENLTENWVSTGKIKDPDNDPLLCTPLDAFDWVSLTGNCTLTLSPKRKDVGDHIFHFRVSDGTYQVDGQASIRVLKKLDPPYWTKNPIELIARVDEPFEHCVSGFAKDPQNEPLTFSCTGQPGFATCKVNGCIAGTPSAGDLGLHTFQMEARNAQLGAFTEIRLRVLQGKQERRIRIGDPVAGAKVENLWVLDLSDYSGNLVSSLGCCIDHYYNVLNDADIHHTGILISSDARNFDGSPTMNYQGDMLLRWDRDHIQDFRNRTQPDSFSFNNEYWTDNCLSTPLWSMQRFYDRIKGFSQIYERDYFVDQVPMDVLIATCQRDHYRYFTSSQTPDGFANRFMSLHAAKKKPYHVSRITPRDSSLSSIKPSQAGPANAYSVVVNATGGKNYHGEDWNYSMGAILKDYAKTVITRAYIYAKKEFTLNPPPNDPAKITITLAGKVLTGNTNQPTDQWSYKASPPSVLIHWNNIDVDELSPDDYLVIEYFTDQKTKRVALSR